jgi:hypothetical protein
VEKVHLVAALVEQIRAYLVRYNVRSWPEILTEWEAMLNRVRTEPDAVAAFSQIREALWGMGRLSDVVIAPEAGHAVTADRGQLDTINEQFISMVKALSDNIAVHTPLHDSDVDR